MALFHLSVTQTKRSAGQSAIASAAYRAGARLYSEYYGEYSDYTRKGGVICSDILLPSHAPPEYADRQTLSASRSHTKSRTFLIEVAVMKIAFYCRVDGQGFGFVLPDEADKLREFFAEHQDKPALENPSSAS